MVKKIMDYYNKFRGMDLLKEMLNQIRNFDKEVKIMEVCGTHTRAIFAGGIPKLLSDHITLISGPGCPICVTTQIYIDKAIELAKKSNVIITSFADFIKVPGNNSSLQQIKALGGDVRVVHSPISALKIAQKNYDKEVIFLAIGFETTAPIIALSLKEADRLKLDNYSILLSLKTMPAIIEKLILDLESEIDGFICPGHVSTIIGSQAFNFIADNYNLAAVIAGFERGDIIMALARILKMVKEGITTVDNLYSRVVKAKGNLKAIAIMNDFFEVKDSTWRGLGLVRNSGLGLKEKYQNFNAENKFKFKEVPQEKKFFCSCGDVLTGKKRPPDCQLFAKDCTPLNPQGPCMVSEEGSCNIYYEYRR
ncbi:hydrogenase expression/formation protein HypD [Orenia marismortui]|uniref:Hydrogenase expression/formation protein HypD n=2 Tax=Orenia marismortui TaxID=46469 RepID=A0A4R8GZU0_9FIRM|nr:hydrogenase expression/formation protein HypD [Orenia marismortui]